MIEDRAGRGGQRAGQLGLAGAGRSVEQHALGRRDPPPRVGLGAAQRQREAAQQVLGGLQPSDVVERDVGMDLGLHPPGEIAELLAELGEDVLEPALQRPL